MASHPRPVMEASAIAPQNSSIILIPCFLNPMYISPAPGIREKINTQKPCFCFFIYLLASVYNFIRKITQIITDILRIFTELGTYLPGKLAQIETNVKGRRYLSFCSR